MKKIEHDLDNHKISVVLFEHFMLDITVHTKSINEYHSDRKSPYFMTVSHDKIKCHQLEAEDPYHIVKKCYLIMIADVTET